MEEVVANIRSALISTKGSSSLQQLQKDYREIVGEFIPFKKFGYSSLESFLNSVPSLRVSKLPNGLITVDAVATDNVKHIVSLVNKQRISKKKVGYVASRFRPSGYVNKSPGYANRSPGYSNRSPGYSGQVRCYPKFETSSRHQAKPKEFKSAVPKPVGNKRRLSVFERLGPKISSEEDLSTFDENEDEFVAKFQSTRQVTTVPRMPSRSGKMSLPANIKISSPVKTSTRFSKKSPPGNSNSLKAPNVSPSSSDPETWTDAATVFQKEDEFTKKMSRLSLMRERINSRNPDDDDFPTGSVSTPSFAGNDIGGLVFNNNLPVTNNNAPSDFDRPRMRTQHSLGATASTSGATRPRPAFISPPCFVTPNSQPVVRPNISRFNQNRFVSSVRLPWQPQEKKVITVETTVDHRIQKCSREKEVKEECTKAEPVKESKIIDPLRLHQLVANMDNDMFVSELKIAPITLENLVKSFKDEDKVPTLIKSDFMEPFILPKLIEAKFEEPGEFITNSKGETMIPEFTCKFLNHRTSSSLKSPAEVSSTRNEYNDSDLEKLTHILSKDIPDLPDFKVLEPLTLNNLSRSSNFKKPSPEKTNPTCKTDTIKRWSDFSSFPVFPGSTEEETSILDVQIPDNFKMEPAKPKIPKFEDIPRLHTFMDVKISHVVDPLCFYVQPFQTSAVLNSLMGRIQGKYSESFSPCDIENILPNSFYALKHQDDFWYRVKVISFISRNQVRVFFCDFGYQVIVSVTELVTLEPEFYEVPFQAINAKLIGIRPNNDTWNITEREYFSNRVLEKSFVSLVASVDNGSELSLGLKLFDTTGDDDVNIAKEMVDKCIAQYDLLDV